MFRSKTDGTTVHDTLTPHLHPINFHPTPHTSSGGAANTVPHHHHNTPSPNSCNNTRGHWGRSNNSRPFLTPDPSPQIYSEPVDSEKKSDVTTTYNQEQRRRRTANSHDVIVAWWLPGCLLQQYVLPVALFSGMGVVPVCCPPAQTRWKMREERNDQGCT